MKSSRKPQSFPLVLHLSHRLIQWCLGLFCFVLFHKSDITSLAGSKVSARSISPGGSVVALSDRLSLASGSLAGVTHDNPLSPQQLGVMGNALSNFTMNYFIRVLN